MHGTTVLLSDIDYYCETLKALHIFYLHPCNILIISCCIVSALDKNP